MEVEILSTEFVKPSSPTPSHLKIHKLSSLDQCMPHHYIPSFLFHQNPNTPLISQQAQREERCQRLKSSLSRLLCLFYPFAGNIRDQFSVLCDDHGVPFTHANAKFPLCNFLQSLDLHSLPKLHPDQSDGSRLRTDIALVQVTDFSCGGFLISTLISHAVADGIAVVSFLRSWSTLCRQADADLSLVTAKPRPNFSASALFPPADHVPHEAMLVPQREPFIKQGKLRVSRLVFGPTAIRALKEEAASPSVPRPSRVEVVSGHLYKCIISALEKKSGCKNGAMVTQMVNLRQRAEPPFPEGSIGNYLWPAVVPRAGEKGNELADLVSELREATTKTDGHLVERMRAMGPKNLFEELGKVYAGAAAGIEFIQFTSCCDFGVYEYDFGWGNPIWVCCIGPPAAPTTVFMNVVILTDTRLRNGVEVLLFLDEEVIALLEQSQELLAYAVFDHGPLLSEVDSAFSQSNGENINFSKL